VAAVLVHIDLDGGRPHASSLHALAAGRAVASSWGATLYAAVIARDPDLRSEAPARGVLRVPGDAQAIEIVRSALASGGADKIVVALTDAALAPLWSALGAAWQAVLDRLRPRLVVFGADAPSATELAPRSAARIGARLLLRARIAGSEEVELRDREGRYARAGDGGAAVAMVGTVPRLARHCDDDVDVLVIAAAPGGADPRIELVGKASTEPDAVGNTTGNLIAVGDDAARDPEIARATRQLARVLGARIVGGSSAAAAGLISSAAALERNAPISPELCVAVGAPAVDVAGATSLVRIGGPRGRSGSAAREVDAALSGSIAEQLADLVHLLEDR
jgi:hypothetical protein